MTDSKTWPEDFPKSDPEATLQPIGAVLGRVFAILPPPLLRNWITVHGQPYLVPDRGKDRVP